VKYLDRKFRDIRIAKARQYLRTGDRLLDLGCFDRTLLSLAQPTVKRAAGIDPLAEPARDGTIEIYRGTIPGEHPFGPGEFDCITMLAVLEHITDKDALARECFRLLAPGGRVIITVPHPFVDTILAGLTRLRLIEGMSLEEHHGYDVRQTPAIFGKAGFRLVRSESFELGLNKLFVLEKPKSWPAQVEPKVQTRADSAEAMPAGVAR
jgi:2-polyprenyl-3-methyl-5-hydroxy-6-metoxy-1,4-benzoquinol methylase